MKAKDYYDKYCNQVSINSDNQTVVKVISELYKDLLEELFEIKKARNATSNKAFIAIAKELNQKANAINRMFEKRDGAPLMKRDFFKSLMIQSDNTGMLKLFWK